MINAKRKTTEWERLEISSRKLDIPREHCFPGGSDGKAAACSVGDPGLIPGLGRSLGESKGCPLQYSDLENPMICIVHRVTRSQTQLSDFHFQKAKEMCVHV